MFINLIFLRNELFISLYFADPKIFVNLNTPLATTFSLQDKPYIGPKETWTNPRLGQTLDRTEPR